MAEPDNKIDAKKARKKDAFANLRKELAFANQIKRNLRKEIGHLQDRIRKQRRRIARMIEAASVHAKRQARGPLWIAFRNQVWRKLQERKERITELEAERVKHLETIVGLQRDLDTTAEVAINHGAEKWRLAEAVRRVNV